MLPEITCIIVLVIQDEAEILFLSPEDMQEAKKSTKEKGIKAGDVKNLPPVEEIHSLNSSPIEETHGLDNPT